MDADTSAISAFPVDTAGHRRSTPFLTNLLASVLQVRWPSYPFSIDQLSIIGSYICSALLFLNLPTVYAARASAYAATPTQASKFIALLIVEWKTFIVCSGFTVSIVFAILQSGYAAGSTILRDAGYASVACSIMSFTMSCILIVVFTARRWDMEAQNEDSRPADSEAAVNDTDIRASQDIAVGANGGHSTSLSAGSSQTARLGPPVLIALPAVFMCWCAAFTVVCMLLFVWHAHRYTGAPDTQRFTNE